MNFKIKNILKTINEIIFVRHAYIFSAIISFLIIIIILFKSNTANGFREVDEGIMTLDIINMEDVKTTKRKALKELTSDDVEESTEETDMDRSSGLSDASDAVDISFNTGIVPPRIIGNVKDIYPEEARKQNVEAVINMELLIAEDGRVLRADIVGISLNKEVPPEIYKDLSNLFRRDVKKIFEGVRYTPTIIDGKAATIKMPLTFKFKLND